MADGFQSNAFQSNAFQMPEEAEEAAPASLGGLMTILLLAQPGARRDRQIVYGPKWPMLRRRK